MERFHVYEDGVQVFASQGEPKRITVLDGELTEGKAGDLTEPALLVADRAFVQVESLQPGSVKPEPRKLKTVEVNDPADGVQARPKRPRTASKAKSTQTTAKPAKRSKAKK